MNLRILYIALFTLLLTSTSHAQFPPLGWLYIGTGTSGFGYVDFNTGSYTQIDNQLVRDIDIDDAFFGGFGDAVYVGGKNVYSYPLFSISPPLDSINNAFVRKINASDSRLNVLSDSIPYLRVYNRNPSFSHDFSLDTNKIPYGAVDLLGYSNLIYVLYQHSVVVVNTNTQDTLLTIQTPSVWPSVAYNTFLCELNGKIYVHTDYATGAFRYSIIEIDPISFAASIAFHYEFQGGTQKFIPTWGGDDKIYHLTGLSHYDVSDDSVYVIQPSTDFVIAYDAHSSSLFHSGVSFHPGGHYISYYNTAGTDTVMIPDWFIDAEYYVIWPGIDENDIAQGTLVVSPNPASTYAELNFGIHTYVKEVAVFDASGKRVYLDNPKRFTDNLIVDLDTFGAGIYIIRCQTDDGQFIGKVSVQRK